MSVELMMSTSIARIKRDAHTQSLASKEVAQSVLSQHKALVVTALEEEAGHREALRHHIANLHLHVTQLNETADFKSEPEPTLTLNKPPAHSLLVRAFGAFFSRTRRLIEEDILAYQAQCQELEKEHAAALHTHRACEAQRRASFEASRQGEPDAMEHIFEEVLSQLLWPYETQVAFEIPHPHVLVFDVDLPEIEDLPCDETKVSKRPLGLKFKPLSQINLRRQYMQHVHAIGFVLSALAFKRLPTLETIILSGYSQRSDPQTAAIVDTYLYSAKMARTRFDEIDMGRLEMLDVVACFELFELRRKMTKTGVFKPIDPFTIEDLS